MEKYSDVIIVGAGAVGSGAGRCVAERGKSVVIFDQYSPPHNLGSSHGDSRITRLAIGEDYFFSPFAIRSHQIWRELEAQTRLELLVQTGGYIIADQSNKSVLHGSKDFLGETEFAAKKFGINYSRFGNNDLKTRLPQFNFTGNEEGYYEPTAGFLRPENCIKAQLEVAKRHGARLLTNTKVTDILPWHDRVIVQTSAGTFTAGKVIISAGAWVKKLLGEKFNSIFEIHRQVLYWFDIKDSYSQFRPDKLPIFIWNRPNDFLYGFSAINGPDGGLKVASENTDVVDPDHVNHEVSQYEIESMYENKVKGYLKGVGQKCIKTVVCISTETPDKCFVIDHHPECKNIIIASPCSHHGFKHSAATAEAAAQLAVDGKTTLDIGPFSLERFLK